MLRDRDALSAAAERAGAGAEVGPETSFDAWTVALDAANDPKANEVGDVNRYKQPPYKCLCC